MITVNELIDKLTELRDSNDYGDMEVCFIDQADFIDSIEDVRLDDRDVPYVGLFSVKQKSVMREHLNDDRPQCCIDHDKYYSVCDTCEYGEDWSKQNG